MSFAPFGIVPQESNNETARSADPPPDEDGQSASFAVAAILPSLFAVILLVLIVVALLIPRFARRESPETKEERRRKRVERLDGMILSQKFRDWRTKELAEHPESVISAEPLCVICLETIDEKALVRGLPCSHVYHQACLDSWYGRCHEYCPLCNRTILPPTAKEGEHSDGRISSRIASAAEPQAISLMV